LWPGNAEELLKQFSLEEFGEMQTIEIQKNWMQNEGYLGVDLDDYSWYDSGNPLSWIIAQIDHALKREDLSEPLTAWLKNRLPF
jgi:UTP-glucose-1-phosphate uridylyltransferase